INKIIDSINLLYFINFDINSYKKKRASGCTIGAVWITIIYYRRVKFESNDNYHCIRKTVLNEDDLST
ncbi:hypothetical protein FWK35_00019888, partial [Aphis craccivora]